MNYKNFTLGDWIGHISGVIEDETTLDGNEMRDLVEFLSTLEQEPTTKNDLAVDAITMEQINKYVIEINKILEEEKDDARWCAGLRYSLRILDKYCGKEDVEAVKDQLPCGEQMDFPSTFDEFAKDYGFKDKDEVYTNGSELIPVFRVKQWLEHISTTKNDLGVDCISRQAVLDTLKSMDKVLGKDSVDRTVETYKELLMECYKVLPSKTPQEPTTKKDPAFCPDRIAKTTHMEVFLHCVEDECVAYKDGKCLKYNSEQEPTTKNDLVTLTFSKGTLKYSCKDYVVYKKDWLRSHYGAEIDIMFGDSQYKEPTTKNDLGVDCISRQALYDALYERFHEEDTNNITSVTLGSVRNFVKDFPSVTPQEPRWIPVSEKLPKPFTFVNATCRSLVDDREDWVIETVYLPIPKEANKHGYSDWGNIPMLNLGEAEVIAWVERIIPQPYKADRSEEE